MKIELRNLKHMKSMSQETPCYTATVYVDGAPSVDVENRGRGGADVQRPRAGSSLEAINAFIARNVPPISMAKHGRADIPCDLELWCHAEIWDADAKARLRKLLKSGVIYVDEGELVQIRFKGMKTIDEQCLAHFAKTRPAVSTLNAMPFEAAWAIAKPLMTGA